MEALENRANPVNVTVSNLADAGAGSLRDAIVQVINSSDVTNTINIAVTVKISLNSALPSLAKALEGGVDVTITGPGSDKLSIERSAAAATDFRIFRVGGNSNVTINGVTIANGRFTNGSGVDQQGAGIKVDGTLTLTNSAVTGCQTTAWGGGISVTSGGRLTLGNVEVSGNRADRDGGGVYAAGSVRNYDPMDPRITIHNNSIIANNTSEGRGGGVFVGNSDMGRTDVVRIDHSSINQNTAKLEGGGLYFATVRIGEPDAVDAKIDKCDIFGNRSRDRNGGALYTGAKVAVLDTQFIDNSGALLAGYAIAVDATAVAVPLTLDICLIRGNHHRATVGGVVQPPNPNSSAIDTGAGKIDFSLNFITNNDGHGVSGTVISRGGNTVENSLTTSNGWLPFPDDDVS